MWFDKILNFLSIIMLVFILAMIFYFIFFMDSNLPEHFDFLGNASGNASGFSLYRLGFLAFAIFIALKILINRVDILNYPVDINELNKKNLYKQMRFLLQSLRLSCLLVIGGIIFGKMIYSVFDINIFGIYFIIFALILVFGPLLYSVYKMSLLKKD